MNEYLRVKATSAGIDNVTTVAASAVSLPLVDEIADLVVSNYCLHELRHDDKLRALAEAMRVLKPGGRLVIGDMMFSLNPMHARDRQVVAVKLAALARRGPPGVWRLLKNATRLVSGRWEYPANASWWDEALRQCGFDRVRVEMLAHEGGIAIAQSRSASAAAGCCELRPVAVDAAGGSRGFSAEGARSDYGRKEHAPTTPQSGPK